jgi:hypothetical protein
MSAEPATEPITFYALAKAAYDEANGDRERAEDILCDQIERNDPPYVVLRRQMLRPAIRDELQKVVNQVRGRLWSGSANHNVGFDRPMPEPLIEDSAPEPVPAGRGVPPAPARSLHVVEVAPDPPTLARRDRDGAATGAPAIPPQAEWAPNHALADKLEGYARRTMLEYPVGRMGLLGDLTINQVREAGAISRRQRRDSTIMEAFFGLVAKDQPGYRKVRELYTAEQLEDLKHEATAIAGNVRLAR